ncbi:hypothetical protein HO173_012594 [Letharia columbiana]|uniref:Uncharacterized protein n=1 Tax=Letharia columbiana TaxID=112416 RepID=A0A8H6CM21_9LECA|nr:uncharacterized protein HO173_012594 [Letharia columbiana]KAF6226004.1 hypothetical protein HO173_012594 [Letharia columbiana]
MSNDGSPFDFHATRSPECPFVRAIQQKKKHRNQKTRQQYKRSLQAVQPAIQPATQPITQPAHQSTQLATQPEHSVEQEEELQQANAENTAEKASGSKAISTKNTAQLSTIPRQVITQQAENTTATWPIIPTALIWYITAMTKQEKDLLRRSQPIGPLQEDIGRCIFGRIKTV